MKTTLKILFLFFCLTIKTKETFGEDARQYAYSNIPASLLKNANAIVRDHNTTIRIISLHEVYVTENYAITVLNEKGKDLAIFKDVYDKFQKIENIKGTLYNKDGAEIKKIKKSEIKDVAYEDGVSMVSDVRIKYFDFGYSVYPYTCEYSVEEKYNNTFFIPSWQPQYAYHCALEHAKLRIVYAPDLPLRYKTFHIPDKPKIEVNDSAVLSLSLSELQAGENNDELSPIEKYHFPCVWLATDKFEINDMQGAMDNWQSYGKFMYDLNAERDILPPEIKKQVHTMIDTCKTTEMKIGILYDYLKKNTRYVGIQLGIGGWQTFPADFVAQKGYGDCKALSNYMKALLKEAGITAYATEVYAGENSKNPLVKEFPTHQANHIIVCIPGKNDTTWLECTSKDCPAGYLSSFTSDRDVLLVTPEGGYVVKTPTYTLENNRLVRKAVLRIDSTNQINGIVELTCRGYMWDKEYGHVNNKSNQSISDHLNSEFSFPSCKIVKYNIENLVEKKIPEIKETISLSGSARVNITGPRLFLDIDIAKLTREIPNHTEKRTRPFELEQSFQVIDTFLLNISGSYAVESLPDEIHSEYAFGSFEYKVTFDKGNAITLTRRFLQKKGIYDANLFTDYIKFCKEVNGVQNQVVLLKKS